MIQKGQFVVIRTFSAGVHVGLFASRKGKEVTLTEARRIWSWKGAHTLHEIALSGVAADSKVSQPVSEITLTEAIEIISGTPAAKKTIDAVNWK